MAGFCSRDDSSLPCHILSPVVTVSQLRGRWLRLSRLVVLRLQGSSRGLGAASLERRAVVEGTMGGFRLSGASELSLSAKP